MCVPAANKLGLLHDQIGRASTPSTYDPRNWKLVHLDLLSFWHGGFADS